MSRVQKILLFTLGITVFIGLGIFILYPIFANPNTDDIVTVEVVPAPSDLTPLPPNNTIIENNTNTVLEPLTGEAMEKDEAITRSEIEQLVRFFVERFGTYSNFDYDFTRSINGFMTNSMQTYAATQVQAIRQGDAGRPVTDYFGVSTRILSVKITSLIQDQSATASIIVQQEVQDGINTPITVSRGDGRVDLVYQNGQWLVDGLFYN